MISIETTSRLPAGYQEVEYIRSTSTTSPDTGQRINTGIYPTQNTKVVADAEYLSGENYATLCGAYTNGTNQFAIFYSGSWTAWFGNSAQKTISGGYSGRKNFTLGGGVFSVDSSSVAISSASFNSGFQLALFAMAQTDDNTFYYHASIKLYSMQIYERSTLVRDYVPCYRKSDNVGGLFDLANNEFYPNIGTGNFSFGAKIGSSEIVITEGGIVPKKWALRRRIMMYRQLTGLPKAYQKVEYIQSSGSQYINTGFRANNNTRVVIDYGYLGGDVVFGAYDANGSDGYGIQADGGKWYMYYGTSGARTTLDAVVGTRYIVDFDKNVLYVNNNLIRTATVNVFQGDNPLILSALYNVSSVGFFTSIKLYACQIYDSGILIRDFIPCYRKADGVAGLYDLANDEFYTNAGSGTFTVGSDV